jgi:hypothetical protein
MKNVHFLLLPAILLGMNASSQSITGATIGSIGGQFRNVNVILDYTLGETFVGSQTNGNVTLGYGFWTIVPTTYVPSAKTIYRFTGTGNFSLPANWEGGILPPNPLPAGAEIIINPAGDGQCILNVTYLVSPEAKFSIIAGKKCVIPINLILK